MPRPRDRNPMPYLSLIRLLVLWLLVSAARLAAAQPVAGRTVLLREMPATGLVLGSGWTFRAGDNQAWARPETNDQQWQPLNPALSLRQLPQEQQAGIGWLRLRFRLGPGLRHRALALGVFQYAASEVYFNGRLLGRYGTVSPTPAESSAPHASVG